MNSCLDNFLKKSPPVKEAEDIAKACHKSNIECLKRIGMKIISEKIENKLEDILF